MTLTRVLGLIAEALAAGLVHGRHPWFGLERIVGLPWLVPPAS